MNKLGIWAIAIAGAFLIGIISANPVVDAVEDWNQAVDIKSSSATGPDKDKDKNKPKEAIYEVSANGIILEGEQFTVVDLLCLDGDWLNDHSQQFGLTIVGDESTLPFNSVFAIADTILFEIRQAAFQPQKAIGIRAFVSTEGSDAPFDIPFTITTLCLSPSP